MAERIRIKTAIQAPLREIYQRCGELFKIAGDSFGSIQHRDALEFQMVGWRKIVIARQDWLATPEGSIYNPLEGSSRFRIDFKPTLAEWWHLNRFRRFDFDPALSIQPAHDQSRYFPFEGEIEWFPRSQRGIDYYPNQSVALAHRVNLQDLSPILGLLTRVGNHLKEKPNRITDIITPGYPTTLVRVNLAA